MRTRDAWRGTVGGAIGRARYRRGGVIESLEMFTWDEEFRTVFISPVCKKRARTCGVWRGFDEGVSNGIIGDTKEAVIPDVWLDDWFCNPDPLGNTKIEIEFGMDSRR